uniref:Transposase n=1 Tax=Globodera rostochiensis TaxID=31243 RepID=A0A914HP02_GLORO
MKAELKRAGFKNSYSYQIDETVAKELGLNFRTLYNWKRKLGQTTPHHNHNEQKKLLKHYYEIKDKNPKMNDEDIAKLLKIGSKTFCTKFVQAADVCWNAPFKAKIRQQYEDWMLHGEKTTTSSGNTRAAPMNIYLNWIYEARTHGFHPIRGQLFQLSYRGVPLAFFFMGDLLPPP